jgi:oligoendopeptidase F
MRKRSRSSYYRKVGRYVWRRTISMGKIACGGWIVATMLASSPRAAMAQVAAKTPAIEAAHLSPTLYFPSATEELTSRNALHTSAVLLDKALESSSSALLVKNLDNANETIIALQRHWAYLRVQSLENTEDQSAKAARIAVSTDIDVLDAAMRSRLRQVPPDQIARLGRFTYLAKLAQQDAAHDFSPDAQRYRGAVTAPFEGSISDAYDRLIDTVGSNKAITSSDLATRRAAIASRNEAYDKIAPVTANLLINLIEIENRDAAAQGYANAADRKYSSLGLSTTLIGQTLSEVQAEAPVYRRYEQVLAEHAARKLGIPSILSAEQDFAYEPSPQISLNEGRQLILESFQPLGQNYIQRFGDLLDPANGRLDLTGGNHRAHTGTSITAYDAPVAFYFSGYDGSLKSVSTMAHEGGHAIHRELMNASGIPVYERTGPHYLFEGYAIFNELLLLDHAAQVAKTPAQREYALERLLWKLSAELFMSAEETAFERSLYTEASGHSLLDRASIDAIYRKSIAPYEYWPMSDVGNSREWMRKSLLFEDPLYLVNYLYAAVVAVALYERSHTDPDFAAKYEKLLRRGFDAPPETLLASMGIQLDDPGLVKAAARLFEAKTEELQQLYQAEPTKLK